jgi:hypothetical protein
MMSTWIRLRPLVTAGVLVLGLAIVSQALGAAPTVWLTTFSIDPSEDEILPNAVSDDGGPDYKDYRLVQGGPGDPNYCVEATLSGGLFIRLNRKLDGDAGTQFCGQHGGSPRQFAVVIAADTACAALSEDDYPVDGTAPCVITGLDQPRIRITNDLYGKGTTRTPVAFLTKWYDTTRVSYEVRTETDATVIKDGLDSSKRTVYYEGNARLWRFAPGVKAKPVADAFPLPFQMTFARTAQ